MAHIDIIPAAYHPRLRDAALILGSIYTRRGDDLCGDDTPAHITPRRTLRQPLLPDNAGIIHCYRHKLVSA